MPVIDPNALGASFERVSGANQVLTTSSTGAMMVALGLGICGTLSVQTFRREKPSIATGILGVIMMLALVEFGVLLADYAYITEHVAGGLGDIAWQDIRFVAASYQITTLIGYSAHWFFGLRVWSLYPSKRVVCIPIFMTAHVSLIVNLALSIKGYLQPHWNGASSQQELAAAAQDFGNLLHLRSTMQAVWMCSNLVCDVLICALIVVALLRMKTFLETTRGVIHRMVVMTSQTMLPPMLMAVLWTGIVVSKQFGPGSWFRNLGPLQSLFYWFAVLWSIRTRKSFLEMLSPPRPPPPPSIIARGSPASTFSIGFDLEPVSCTLVPAACCPPMREKLDMAVYSSQEQIQILTFDEALRDPNREEV